MKLRIFGLIVLLVFCFGAVDAYSEEPKELMHYLLDMAVMPSKVAEFEKALKTLMAAHEKYNYKAGYITFVRDDFHYFFQMPIDNFAGIDNIRQINAEFSNKIGKENFQKLMNNFDGTYKCYQESVATLNQNISYLPENPRIKKEEVKYLFWNYWYLKPGTEEQMNQIWKEWADLYNKINVKDGWNAWICRMGWEAPFYVSTLYGKSDADYYNAWSKNIEIGGDKHKELMNKALSLCRKFEVKVGTLRPDLSYKPKTE